MGKICISVNLDDGDLLDDAAIQAIKTRIRSLVDQELDRRVKEEIDSCVRRRAETLADAMRRGYCSSDVKDKLRTAIINAASNVYVSETLVKQELDNMLRPIKVYALEAIQNAEAKAKGADKEIDRMIRDRVDLLFNRSLTDAIRQATAQNEEE